MRALTAALLGVVMVGGCNRTPSSASTHDASTLDASTSDASRTETDGARDATAPAGPVRTQLSLQAERTWRAKEGATRAEFVAALGPATWARMRGEKGFADDTPDATLELSWRNGQCQPVVVEFDREMKALSIQDGRICLAGVVEPEPGPEFSCSRPDRAKRCR